MSAGHAGQVATVTLAALLIAIALYRSGFIRGFRREERQRALANRRRAQAHRLSEHDWQALEDELG